MPRILGELKDACTEQLSSDPGGTVQGRIWTNTTENRIKTDDGTNKRALLRNDQNAVIGNSGTANNNVRLHRGDQELLQFVKGGDATTEASMSTNLAKISAKIESYANFASLPAFGNQGRVAYLIDQDTFFVDTGAAWTEIISERFLTTKGDIIGRDSSTMVRVPVGSDGQVLTADSGEASGLAWATPAAALTYSLQYQEFTSSGTFNVPASVDVVFVELWGGGGGGGGGGAGAVAGGTGGTTSFGSLDALGGAGGAGAAGAGGAGGNRFGAWGAGGAGANSSGLAGAGGATGLSYGGGGGGAAGGGSGGGGGGAGPGGAGANGGAGNNNGGAGGANTGAGGGGGGGPNPGTTRGGGGGEGSKYVSRMVPVTPLGTVTVTIGAGGTGGAGETGSATGGAGGSGYCRVMWVAS